MIQSVRAAAAAVASFVDALIEFEMNDIQRITVAATPVIVAQVFKEGNNP